MTSPPPSADAEQLQTVMQHIDALHNTLTGAMTGFGTLVSDTAAQQAAPAGASQPATQIADVVHQLTDYATQLHDAIAQGLTQAVDALHQATTQTHDNTQQHAQDWDHNHDTLATSLSHLEQSVVQTAQTAVTTFADLSNALLTITEQTVSLVAHYAGATTALEHDLQDTVTGALGKAADEFKDGVSNVLHADITQHLASIFANGDQALQNLNQTAEHVAQQFAHDAEDALQTFAHGIADGMKNDIEQVAEHLAKDVVEMLSSFVATSIAEATAGAAITAAMSPILPEVIVVKEASEAIKDLISVFKAVGSLL
jgi:predicted PurR-regulated permease PerM